FYFIIRISFTYSYTSICYNKCEINERVEDTMSKQTPMVQQYLKIKEQYTDAFLFFRLGDFYEMFFDDAILAARELEITLTKRDSGKNEPIPMCGVPHHSAEGYIQNLVEKGYKIAI